MDQPTPGEIVGRNLRAMRDAQLLSQRELAERSGVAKITIATLELGRSAHPRRRTVEKLARALGVDVEVLMEGTESPKAPVPPSPEQESFNGLLEEERRANVERLEQEAGALLERVRATLALLELHMSDPPAEEEWDRALERYLAERAEPLKMAIQLLEEDSTNRALAIGLINVAVDQMRISSQIETFNEAQYGHRHRDVG